MDNYLKKKDLYPQVCSVRRRLDFFLRTVTIAMVSLGEGVLLSISVILLITLIGVIVYLLHKKNRKRIHDAETRMKKGKGYTQDAVFDGTSESEVTGDVQVIRHKRKRQHKRHRRQRAITIGSSTETEFDGMPTNSVNVNPHNAVKPETVGLEGVTLEDVNYQGTSEAKRDPVSVKDNNNLEQVSRHSVKSDKATATGTAATSAPLSVVLSHDVLHCIEPQCKAPLETSADCQEEMTPNDETRFLENLQNKFPVTEDYQKSTNPKENRSPVEITDPREKIKPRDKNVDKARKSINDKKDVTPENVCKTNGTKSDEKLPTNENVDTLKDINGKGKSPTHRDDPRETIRDRIEEWRRNLKATQSKISVPLHLVMSSICQKYSVDPVLIKYLTGPPKLVGMETYHLSRRQMAHAECRLFRIWRDRYVEKTTRKELLKQRAMGICRKNSGKSIKAKSNLTTRYCQISKKKPKTKLTQECFHARYTQRMKSEVGVNTTFYDMRNNGEILSKRNQTQTAMYPQIPGYRGQKRRELSHRNVMTCSSFHTRLAPARHRIRPPWL